MTDERWEIIKKICKVQMVIRDLEIYIDEHVESEDGESAGIKIWLSEIDKNLHWAGSALWYDNITDAEAAIDAVSEAEAALQSAVQAIGDAGPNG